MIASVLNCRCAHGLGTSPSHVVQAPDLIRREGAVVDADFVDGAIEPRIAGAVVVPVTDGRVVNSRESNTC